ncbi:DUF3368 domain-containing protein [Mucilaginibacter dorajii]|uniref:DUF3368 domain-containing protein n=1 Tax=Mucilaginibacter dorajii TaxID=692994 RepID=A0ABP7QE21_9SPHI|nr:DUF3368 domain-containing protein [Mucilaginibacter dorajii]MCS3733310.1 putative nucleic acid-binding protein [Mucilaginibacter dorajii]
MQAEYEIVIADTTCFILLDKIGEFNLLKSLFGKVTTTTVIAEEFGSPLPEWIIVKPTDYLQIQVMLDIDAGEASAISLAMESKPSLLILDDHKARLAAERMHLNYTGTFGLILRAKQNGIIPSVASIIVKIQNTNFHYSQSVINEILRLAGED